MKNIIFLLPFLFSQLSFSQNSQPLATSSEDRLKSYEIRKSLLQNSSFKNVKFESIGPSVFGGRIVDLDVNPTDPTNFYAAYASGGLWQTKNNGTTFEPIFDNEAVMTIGDIAVNWEANHIWVGTGENNSSRSSYAGIGIFKSEDGGESWQYKGLPESHHIGRIVLHPTDPNTLWVAVLGHLYSPNIERGVYKTTDGGNTWNKTLFVNENAGAVDLLIDPQNPDILYAASWQRERRAWNFIEAGEGSGIFKSTDAGESWTRISEGNSGFPSHEEVGRIGLGCSVKNGKTILYASLDNYQRRPTEEDKEDGDELKKEDFRKMSSIEFAELEEEKLDDFLKANRFPKKYTAKKIKQMVKKEKIKPLALVEYLEDANSLLFDTPVIGAQLYVSHDEGVSWTKTHDGNLDDLFYSYGYYFGQVRVHPTNPDKLFLFGVPILKSIDGGKTFKSVNGDNVHVDHHACWINPVREGHVIIGNDGGVNITYDSGESWIKCNSPAVGQFYTVAVDQQEPYNVYGGLQDNGVWKGPNNYKASSRWHASGKYPYKSLFGGDGMQVAIDSRNNDIIYTGYQFGNYSRIDQSTGKSKAITPKHELGERPLRWNWQTPIHLSVHNQDILYMGSNKLHRSFNQGDDFKTISEDLTKSLNNGDVAYSTLTSIHESPLQFGLLYAGSDDGRVHCSKDGGLNWINRNDGIPDSLWVSRIQASQHEKSSVYLSLNGYRWDDFKAYIYKSEDYGETWESIAEELPLEPVNVIKEDKMNPDIIYAGTDHGLYISFNKGKNWDAFQGNLPAVAIHDLVVEENTGEILLGTHGRSFWKTSAKEIRQLNEEIIAAELHLFPIENLKRSERWGNTGSTWRDPKIPELSIAVWTYSASEIELEIRDANEKLIKTWSENTIAGMNEFNWDMSIDQKTFDRLNVELPKKDQAKKSKNDNWYLPKGEYKLIAKKAGSTIEQSFILE